VEFSLARFAFQSTAANVLIYGVTVEKYANPAQRGAINGRDGSNWSVENCDVRLNSGAGISIGTGGRIVGSNIHHNGQIGAVMVGKRLLLQENVIADNNRLNFDFTWEAGGIKIADSDDIRVSRNFVYHNNGPGLWCDIECRNAVLESNRVEYNADAGIFYEISYRGVIRNNVVAYNGQAARPWYWGADIQIAASENVDVYENVITSRIGGNSIMLIDQSRPRPGGGKYRTTGNFIYGNVINFSGIGHAGGASDTKPGDENFSIIEKGGNRFDNNTYKAGDGDSRVSFVWGHDIYDWNQFRQMGQETGATLSYD
jgi:parallel beta-helix repeat protein